MTDIQKGESKTVLLHRDAHMKRMREAHDCQPVQLDLFQMLISKNYSNSVELYTSLPDEFSWKQDKFRNPDGSLPVLSRQGIYNKTPYMLDISPANITVIDSETKTKKKLGFYKTVIAQFVERALHKLSIADGFFLNDDDVQTDNFGLITTYYKIREELKSAGKNYSYEQIREAISILAGLRYELSWDICKDYGIDSFFSPIDLIVKNDRKNPHHSELFITFNRLISKKILALDWRSFNYHEFMKLKTTFGRTLFMRLFHRFTQADSINGYHFRLSTLLKEWALQPDLITTNIKQIEEGIKDCAYIIDRYDAKSDYSINPTTNRRILSDYKVTVYPTEVFQDEQYRSNAHRQNIANHRISDNGKAIIKPMRDQYPTSHDYERYRDDLEAYDEARKQ